MTTKPGRDQLSYLVNSIQTKHADIPNWDDSIRSPAVYFLTQVVNLNKSLRYCMGQFPSKDKTISRIGYKSIDKLDSRGAAGHISLERSRFCRHDGAFRNLPALVHSWPVRCNEIHSEHGHRWGNAGYPWRRSRWISPSHRFCCLSGTASIHR